MSWSEVYYIILFWTHSYKIPLMMLFFLILVLKIFCFFLNSWSLYVSASLSSSLHSRMSGFPSPICQIRLKLAIFFYKYFFTSKSHSFAVSVMQFSSNNFNVWTKWYCLAITSYFITTVYDNLATNCAAHTSAKYTYRHTFMRLLLRRIHWKYI